MKPVNPLLAVSSVLAAAAAACAVWFGVSWYSAASSPTLSEARTRDLVLQAAEQAVINFNTLDYHQAAQGLRVWLDSSTGNLHNQLAQNLSQEVQIIEAASRTTSARVLDGAVTQLDTSGGTATVLMAVDVTVTPAKGSPFTEAESEIGQLARTSSGWKLSSLGYAQGSSAAGTSPTGTGSR